MAKNYLFSIKSLEVHQGGTLFEGLLSMKVTCKKDGRKSVHGTGGRRYGRTRGGLVVEVEMTFEGTSFFRWHKDHPGLLDKIFESVVMSLREGSEKAKVELLELDFPEVEIPVEGDDEMKVPLKGEAKDCKINDLSLADGDTFTALPAAA